jgi:hypothetical protein
MNDPLSTINPPGMPAHTGDTALVSHLAFIQAAVSRMAANSFLLKGWSVTLVAGLFALAANQADALLAAVALLPALAFWGLDAYYLRQERLFRALYHDVARPPERRLAVVEPYSLSTAAYQSTALPWLRTLQAPSVLIVHGMLVLAVLSLTIYLALD